MWNTMTLMMISATIAIVMIILASALSKKVVTDREKSSPFECGFDPKSSPRLPFSIQFFLISMLFLIFDVEIALILPIIPIAKISSIKMWWILSSSFIMILIVGLFYEWKQGALKWAS
uniref:NADH-ubiquinone oxidoreductase chain 3 n=1 Tax=Saussurella borneensis TaxID=510017 RepID=A0A8F2JFK0_9ORTH|nr:NADH dehydrogenase subunit 3 [Saussurella borneensis]